MADKSKNTCTPIAVTSHKKWRKEEWQNKPLMVYDGECGFCLTWIERWKKLTCGHVIYAPFQEIEAFFPSIAHEKFQKSVKFIEPNGRVFDGAHAVFHALHHAGRKKWLLWMYEKIPGLSFLSEKIYYFIATHRSQRLFKRVGKKEKFMR